MRDYICLPLEPHHQLCRCLPGSSPPPIIETDNSHSNITIHSSGHLHVLLNHVQCVEVVSYCLLDPLTTDDECSRHATLAACYQLGQSILKIDFVLTKKVG